MQPACKQHAASMQPACDCHALGGVQAIDVGVFIFFYVFYVLLSLILLLNLLVAMLANTFDSVREEATLECRTSL